MFKTHESFRRKTPGIAALTACCLAATASSARADTPSEVKAQIEALQKKLTELENVQTKADQDNKQKIATLEKQQAAGTPDNAVTGGATKGSFKLPGSNTSVTVGGYVKLDAIFSDKSAGVDSQGNQFLFPSLIPVGPDAGANKKDQATLHARQSRLFLKTSTPTAYGELSTLLEGDFFGADGNESVSNSHSFRIRHAFATLGNFSAGQYWSNFLNETAFPETLDFGGPVGEIFNRQAQARWTQKFAGGDWSVSLENPESVFAVPNTANTFRADRDKVPDITGRLKFNVGTGNYSVQVLARNIRVDSAAAPAAVADKWGGAIGIAGLIPVLGNDDVRFDLNAGNVIGRYQELGFFPDGFINSAGKVDLASEASGFAAYRHFWTSTLRSSLVLSGAKAKNPTGTFGGINKSSRSEHLNLIWSPVPAVNLGMELINASRTVEDDRDGNLHRVQFSAQYGF